MGVPVEAVHATETATEVIQYTTGTVIRTMSAVPEILVVLREMVETIDSMLRDTQDEETVRHKTGFPIMEGKLREVAVSEMEEACIQTV